VSATLRGVDGRDTTGLLALDTGAGYLAIDRPLSAILAIADSVQIDGPIGLAYRPLPRIVIGDLTVDQVTPVLTVDATVVRQVTDRPVVGLLGQRLFDDRILWLDYEASRVALIPAGHVHDRGEARDDRRSASAAVLGARLSPRAVGLPFLLEGDGKIVIRARVSDPRPPRFGPWLDLIVDTGATKSVLFEEALGGFASRLGAWPAVRGLTAPTLMGISEASLARVPAIELAGAVEVAPTDPSRVATLRVVGTDVAILRSELSEGLARAAGRTIHGIVGYPILRRHRVAIDYPRRILWLDPIPDYREPRPFEHSHIGLQLERRDGHIVVSGIAEGSPAARAGVARGDRLVAVDEEDVAGFDLGTVTRRLEGKPGTTVTVTIRRASAERLYRLVRRRLL
jgi:hypothetical protein